MNEVVAQGGMITQLDLQISYEPVNQIILSQGLLDMALNLSTLFIEGGYAYILI